MAESYDANLAYVAYLFGTRLLHEIPDIMSMEDYEEFLFCLSVAKDFMASEYNDPSEATMDALLDYYQGRMVPKMLEILRTDEA